jgi:hypothetical protein
LQVAQGEPSPVHIELRNGKTSLQQIEGRRDGQLLTVISRAELGRESGYSSH